MCLFFFSYRWVAQNYEEKNIRRRVYDALNVLMAINIIEKESDAVTFRWKGIPTGTDSIKLLQTEQKTVEERIAQKQAHLSELLSQVRYSTMPCNRSALTLDLELAAPRFQQPHQPQQQKKA